MSALPRRSTESQPAGKSSPQPTRSRPAFARWTIQGSVNRMGATTGQSNVSCIGENKMIWHKAIGNGPTKVLVIHGWFWDHQVFTPIFESLDTDRYTYAFVDIRGYGNSRKIFGPYSIGEVAADAIALADQLGWGESH